MIVGRNGIWFAYRSFLIAVTMRFWPETNPIRGRLKSLNQRVINEFHTKIINKRWSFPPSPRRNVDFDQPPKPTERPKQMTKHSSQKCPLCTHSVSSAFACKIHGIFIFSARFGSGRKHSLIRKLCPVICN